MEQRRQYKRKFSYGQLYRTMVALPRALAILGNNRKSMDVHPMTIERIMLAVTEVNGCAACSYAHTKMALREGIDNEEIVAMLSGNTDTGPAQEAKAIMFAQHFAETKGLVDRQSYDLFLAEYTGESAHIMLAAMQVILFGNAYGIPYSALVSRLRGKPYRESSLAYEVGMLVWGLIGFPIALLHALVGCLFSQPIIRFSRDS